jgi:hypothetical protein
MMDKRPVPPPKPTKSGVKKHLPKDTKINDSKELKINDSQNLNTSNDSRNLVFLIKKINLFFYILFNVLNKNPFFQLIRKNFVQ